MLARFVLYHLSCNQSSIPIIIHAPSNTPVFRWLHKTGRNSAPRSLSLLTALKMPRSGVVERTGLLATAAYTNARAGVTDSVSELCSVFETQSMPTRKFPRASETASRRAAIVPSPQRNTTMLIVSRHTQPSCPVRSATPRILIVARHHCP